jgi:hypothetical protein
MSPKELNEMAAKVGLHPDSYRSSIVFRDRLEAAGLELGQSDVEFAPGTSRPIGMRFLILGDANRYYLSVLAEPSILQVETRPTGKSGEIICEQHSHEPEAWKKAWEAIGKPEGFLPD